MTEELKELLSLRENVPAHELVDRLWSYIDTNDAQYDQGDGMLITPKTPLMREIFGPDDFKVSLHQGDS